MPRGSHRGTSGTTAPPGAERVGPVTGLTLDLPKRGTLRILCLGAHSDDIEIGCGGTILRLLASRRVLCRWVVFSSSESAVRQREAHRSAVRLLARAASAEITIRNFRDGFFPFIGAEIKEFFEVVAREGTPDLIFTHHRYDRHQDHRLISDLTWNTFRRHLILEYEVPKYDGDLGIPNCFVSLDRTVSRQKVRHLLSSFGSQRDKRWFTGETFFGLMRLRGIECASPSGYAEAFYGRKLILA